MLRVNHSRVRIWLEKCNLNPERHGCGSIARELESQPSQEGSKQLMGETKGWQLKVQMRGGMGRGEAAVSSGNGF